MNVPFQFAAGSFHAGSFSTHYCCKRRFVIFMNIIYCLFSLITDVKLSTSHKIIEQFYSFSQVLDGHA